MRIEYKLSLMITLLKKSGIVTVKSTIDEIVSAIKEYFEENVDARDVDYFINVKYYEEEDTRLILKHSGHEPIPDINDRSIIKSYSKGIKSNFYSRK